jgi:NADPH:quinone reductase-like Zn-dependent oxidoreductase
MKTYQLKEADKPVLKVNEVLIKVHAASTNPLDWYSMTGTPYLMRIRSVVGAENKGRFFSLVTRSLKAVS